MFGERHGVVAGRHIDVQRRNPDRLFRFELIHRDGEAARALGVHLDREARRIRMDGGIAREAARGIGVAMRDQVRPDDVHVVQGGGWDIGVSQGEIRAIDVAVPGARMPHSALDRVAGLE